MRARVGFAIRCGGALQPHEEVEAGEKLAWRDRLEPLTLLSLINTLDTVYPVSIYPTYKITWYTLIASDHKLYLSGNTKHEEKGALVQSTQSSIKMYECETPMHF